MVHVLSRLHSSRCPPGSYRPVRSRRAPVARRDQPRFRAKMASVEEPHSVNTKEKGSTVIVTLVIPGLTVTYFSRQPRNFTVDPKFSERSYEVMVKIRNKNEERLVQHRIKRLPGEIVPMNCSLEYKKDQIILKLAKRNQESWAIALSQSGLEQG